MGLIDIFRMDVTDKAKPTASAQIAEINNLIRLNIDLNRTETANAAPHLEESRKPDTGFSGVRYTIEALFFMRDEATLSGPADEAAKLITWYKETAHPVDSTGKSIFRNGRFGITLTSFPELSVTPTTESGLRLVRFNYDDQPAYGIKTATIVLDHSGLASGLGS